MQVQQPPVALGQIQLERLLARRDTAPKHIVAASDTARSAAEDEESRDRLLTQCRHRRQRSIDRYDDGGTEVLAQPEALNRAHKRDIHELHDLRSGPGIHSG